MIACGRPTKTSGAPCRNAINWPGRTCPLHETAEDVAYREGWEAGRKWQADSTVRWNEHDRERWIKEGRRLEAAERDFRTHTASRHQIVTCDGGYAYTWAGPDPLAVGDRVMLPANYVNRAPFEGTVTGIGSSYRGVLSAVLRKLPADVAAGAAP
jgi:hypothetical protein